MNESGFIASRNGMFCVGLGIFFLKKSLNNMGTFQEKVNKVFSNNPKLCLFLIHQGYIAIKQIRTVKSVSYP